MSLKKWVKFFKHVTVRDHEGEITFEAQIGDEMQLTYASAQRWIRRGVAGEISKPEKKAEPVKKASAKKAVKKAE